MGDLRAEPFCARQRVGEDLDARLEICIVYGVARL
jgi:hypothetical protein